MNKEIFSGICVVGGRVLELQCLGSINLPLKNIRIQPGQRFLVEVINRDPNGKAQIRIGGQIIPALLEITVQPGEKFWAGVQKIDASGILLVRDKDLNLVKGMLLDPQRVERLYLEFGQTRDNSLGNLLKQALSSDRPNEDKGAPAASDGKGVPIISDGKRTPVSEPMNAQLLNEVKTIELSVGKTLSSISEGNNTTLEEIIALTGKEMIASFVRNNIPQWSDLSKEGFMQLFHLLKGLGLDYERRLRHIDNMTDDDLNNLQLELKKSLKGILLSLVNSREVNGDNKSLLSGLLERLIGQQILLQGGNSEAPFYLLEIPIQADGDIYTQTFAIKASRKGKKIDLDHCRLGLKATSPFLGEVGLEGWLFEGRLSLRVYSDKPELLQSLIEANFTQTHELFKEMGIILNPIGVSSLQKAEEFQRFLRGDFREGVNYQV